MSRKLSLVGLLFLSGCFGVAPRPLSLEGYRSTFEPELGSIRSILQERSTKVRALRALYKTTLRKSIERQQFKQIIVFGRPDRFRSELLATNFNSPTNLVVTKGSALQGIDFTEKRFFEGTSNLENLERLLSVPFLPEEVMLWLTGAYSPVSSSELLGTVVFVERGSGEHFAAEYTFRGDRVVQVRGAVRRKDRFARLDGITVFERQSRRETFSSTYEYEEGQELPSRISFWVPDREIRGELELESASLNPDPNTISERVFALSAPKGFRMIELDDQVIDSGEVSSKRAREPQR